MTRKAMARAWFRVAGRVALAPFTVAVAYVLAGGIPSWSTSAYALACAGLLVGLATLPCEDPARGMFDASVAPPASPRRPRRPSGVARLSFGALVAILLVRCSAARTGAQLFREAPFPSGLLGAVVDEGDLAVTGARLLVRAGALVDDAEVAPDVMRDAYARLRAEHGDVGSPALPTLLGLVPPRSGSADRVVVQGRLRERSRTAVVFLHGFGGSFVLPCWTVADAALAVLPNVLTVCPSLDGDGHWGSAEGERILRATLADLRARGIERFVLVGLSNGAFGLAQLEARMRSELTGLAGLVLVSGADPSAPRASVPVLVVHGARDRMTSHASSAAYAATHGARLVSLDAGHLGMLVDRRAFDDAFGDFLREHLGEPAAAVAEGRADGWPDEDRLAVVATTALVGGGRIRDTDAPRLVAAMTKAYADAARERAEHGAPRFSREPMTAADAGAFADLHVVSPSSASSRTAVVFLHGMGGRFALPCWRVGRVASRLASTTFCPATDDTGAWAAPHGERVLRATLAHVAARGFDRVVLVGLSSGGIGASRLAAALAREDLVRAFVFLSGVDPSAVAPRPARPTLVVHGTADTMDGVWAARAYAARTSSQLVEVPAGHFALLTAASEVDASIERFLRETLRPS